MVKDFLRSLCVCRVCVKINNDELFCNAFPFENSYAFYLWIDLDVVRSTGNLSSYLNVSFTIWATI